MTAPQVFSYLVECCLQSGMNIFSNFNHRQKRKRKKRKRKSDTHTHTQTHTHTHRVREREGERERERERERGTLTVLVFRFPILLTINQSIKMIDFFSATNHLEQFIFIPIHKFNSISG